MNKQQQIKRAKRLINGLILEWSDSDPLSGIPHINRARVSHTRPILRLQADNVWAEFKQWILQYPGLLWRINICAIFQYSNGMVQREARNIVARGCLRDIAETCLFVIEDAHRCGANHQETEFKVQCLGDREKRESDFEDYEKAS